MKIRVYLACGLTHVPARDFESYVSGIHLVAREFEDQGCEVSYALVDSDPQLASYPESQRARLCYEWDRRMVEWSSLVVAESSYPSTGMGIELQIAADRNIPIVFLINRKFGKLADRKLYELGDGSVHELQIGDRMVSLMALGLPNVIGQIVFDDTSASRRRVVARTLEARGRN